MSKVAVLKTSPMTVVNDYSRLIELADYRRFLSRDVLLKLNLSWSKYYPACSTQPWQLEGVIKKLRGYKLRAVENETVVTDVFEGVRNNKWYSVLRENNVPFVPLTQVEWMKFKPKAEMLTLDKIFEKGLYIPRGFLGKSVVHLPTMKTHGHTVMTGAMKNAFGGLITKKRHHCHKKIHEVLVDLLAIQKEIHSGVFAVMDGTVAGDGAGPRTMVVKEKNYISASGDQVAIDAVSAKMMGFDPMRIKFIKLAHDRGLGCGDVDQIDVVGENITNVNFNFKVNKSPVIFWDQMFRKGALSFVEPMLFHTGLFKLAVFGSAFYHDRLWYNTVGRYRVNKFMKSSWGSLWKKY
jgi:uncharacterized protein (DUF362 family)